MFYPHNTDLCFPLLLKCLHPILNGIKKRVSKVAPIFIFSSFITKIHGSAWWVFFFINNFHTVFPSKPLNHLDNSVSYNGVIVHIIFTFVYISTELMLFRNCRKDDEGDTSKDRRAGMYDGFSETQTESQVLSCATPFTFQVLSYEIKYYSPSAQTLTNDNLKNTRWMSFHLSCW